MITTVKIETLEDVSKLIFEQFYDDEQERYRSPFLYRGMPNAKFALMTSLQRNCKEKKNEIESSILRNFTKYATHEDPKLKESVWRQLIIGQHHGLPTRLMDWTFSPLIALHFATSGEDLAKMDRHDSVVWKIDYLELNRLLPMKYQERLLEENAFMLTVDMLHSLVGSLQEYDRDMQDQSMVIVEPPSIEQRIANQYSYFSIIPNGIDQIEDFLAKKTTQTVRYIIDRRLRWRIRDMLDQMNINERIIYPGLDGVSMSIKRHYYVR